MADEIDEAAARTEDRGEGIDRAKAILTEFVDATRSAIEAMLDDRKAPGGAADGRDRRGRALRGAIFRAVRQPNDRRLRRSGG